MVRPYIGAGVNYTLFYGSDEGLIADAVDYDSSLGFDIFLNDKWFINLDAKYL